VRLPGNPIRLGSGEFFGEIALLTKKPRIADVVTLSYCRLLVLEVGDFSSLLGSDPALRRSIDQVARQRLGQRVETV
jgi:CPA1 family monovalent cation:H+ antiporter